LTLFTVRLFRWPAPRRARSFGILRGCGQVAARSPLTCVLLSVRTGVNRQGVPGRHVPAYAVLGHVEPHDGPVAVRRQQVRAVGAVAQARDVHRLVRVELAVTVLDERPDAPARVATPRVAGLPSLLSARELLGCSAALDNTYLTSGAFRLVRGLSMRKSYTFTHAELPATAKMLGSVGRWSIAKSSCGSRRS